MSGKDILKKLSAPLTPLNRMLRKKNDRILIYSNLGLRDNAKSMLDYLVSHRYNEKYKITVSCEGHKRYKKYAPKNVRFVGGLGGLRAFLRSRYMFYSFGKFPIMPSPQQTVVNLWHGMPLKTVGKLEKGANFDGRCYFDLTVATSPMFSEIMQKCFCCRGEQVLCVGQPRDDKLYRHGSSCKKLILWLPTYRTSAKLGSANSHFESELGLPLIDSEQKLRRIDHVLTALGCKLIVKPHPMQDVSAMPQWMKSIIFVSERILEHKNTDVFELMCESCGLITDYSSVAFDYMLLDRPIGYTLEDLSEYERERGFTVADPLGLMAGEHITDFEGLERFIRSCAACKDPHRQRRRKVNELVNSAQNGRACERILDACGIE